MKHQISKTYLQLTNSILFDSYESAKKFIKHQNKNNKEYKIGIFDKQCVDGFLMNIYYNSSSNQPYKASMYIPIIRRENEQNSDLNMYGTTFEQTPERALRHAILWSKINKSERMPFMDYNLNNYIDLLVNNQDILELNVQSMLNFINILQNIIDLNNQDAEYFKQYVSSTKLSDIKEHLEHLTNKTNYYNKTEKRFKSNRLPITIERF